MICLQTKKVLRVFVEINLQTAKHLTRFRRGSSKKKVVIVYLWHLTKEVHPCKGPPDTSCLVYPYPLPQCLGELGYSSVVVCFNGDFDGNGLKSLWRPNRITDPKPPLKQT